MSSPNPNFSKPRSRTATSDFWSRLTNQLIGRLKSTIPNLQIYLPKMANSEKLGLRIDNPCRIVFLSLRMNKCLERINDRHFWNPGVFSYAMIPRCRLNSFFLIVTSIVYDQYPQSTNFILLTIWRQIHIRNNLCWKLTKLFSRSTADKLTAAAAESGCSRIRPSDGRLDASSPTTDDVEDGDMEMPRSLRWAMTAWACSASCSRLLSRASRHAARRAACRARCSAGFSWLSSLSRSIPCWAGGGKRRGAVVGTCHPMDHSCAKTWFTKVTVAYLLLELFS